MQLTLEQALSTLLRQPIAIVGCGRTDTGVHASDFYAHFNVEDESIGKGAMENLVFKLNSFLPADIALQGHDALRDTMTDLILDFAGAALVAVYGLLNHDKIVDRYYQLIAQRKQQTQKV